MNIRKYRDAMGWSLERVAVAMEEEGEAVTRQTCHNWEVGKCQPGGRKLLALARVFGVEPGKLYEDGE